MIAMNDLKIIQEKIYEIRGQRVMLDFDLAEAYGVETAQLDAISMALAELQAKEPTKKERKTIRFVQYDK